MLLAVGGGDAVARGAPLIALRSAQRRLGRGLLGEPYLVLLAVGGGDAVARGAPLIALRSAHRLVRPLLVGHPLVGRHDPGGLRHRHQRRPVHVRGPNAKRRQLAPVHLLADLARQLERRRQHHHRPVAQGDLGRDQRVGGDQVEHPRCELRVVRADLEREAQVFRGVERGVGHPEDVNRHPGCTEQQPGHAQRLVDHRRLRSLTQGAPAQRQRDCDDVDHSVSGHRGRHLDALESLWQQRQASGHAARLPNVHVAVDLIAGQPRESAQRRIVRSVGGLVDAVNDALRRRALLGELRD